MPFGLPEFVQNPENRCPVTLILDCAASNRPALMLRDMKFRDLFHWLSACVRRVSLSCLDSQRLCLPPATGWAEVRP